MARDLLTPVHTGAQRDLARGLVFRKQILPETTITYDGRPLVFDHKYLTDLVDAFKKGAYDQVPFTLADAENRHTMDPERIRGEVASVSLAEPGEAPGLYATITFPNAEAAKAVMNNPKLGVSCRIREGVAKSDGRSFSKAIVHVCGTPDPRVTGMSPWRKVDLSGYTPSKHVIDLSNRTYTEDTVPKNQTKTAGAKGAAADADEQKPDLSAWTDEDLQELATELGITDDEIQAFLDAKTTEDDEPDEDEDEDEDDEEASTSRKLVGAGAGADLSTVHQVAVAAGQRADEALRQLADSQWQVERDRLMLAGVPAAAIDLCAPYLSEPGGFNVDLSNADGGTDTKDVAGDFRKLLGLMSGFVDLTSEQGHGGGFVAGSDADPDASDLKAWDQQFPG